MDRTDLLVVCVLGIVYLQLVPEGGSDALGVIAVFYELAESEEDSRG